MSEEKETTVTEKGYIADFDNLHTLSRLVYKSYQKGDTTEDEVVELVENWIIAGFKKGIEIGCKDLELDATYVDFFEKLLGTVEGGKIQQLIERKIDGKTYADRIEEHLVNNDGASSLETILTTEYHNAVNSGIYNTGDSYNQVSYGEIVEKGWKTMLDEKVRDTHAYLEGMWIPIDQDFYTYNGDHAPYPGAFGIGEEDCNCRCRARIRRRKK